MKKLSIIIPCRNEEKGLGSVLEEIPYGRLSNLGYQTEVIVVDNNSSDQTGRIARKHKARVIFEKRKGKGFALLAGFRAASRKSDYLVVMDGDNTYKPSEIPRLVEPLESGFADMITGSRLGGKMFRGSISYSHRVVNWLLAFLVRQFYLANITDTLSGFFALKREVVENLYKYLSTGGFAIEMEIITKLAKLKCKIYSVPITYDRRLGESKVHSFSDGIKILKMFLTNLFWTPKKGKLRSAFEKFVFSLTI